MKNIICLLLCFVAIGISAQNAAHPYTLKGRVVDASGDGIIGANVKAKAKTTGVITDLNGDFSMSVSSTDVELVVSFIGYQPQTVKLKPGENNIKVTLKDGARQLDEIVVVGYGTQKKSALTSSIEVIHGEELLNMPALNIDQALNGQVAGLQVMSSTGDPSSSKESTLSIRGVKGAPLLVIDGVPRFTNNSGEETRLSDLNPDDVESISILKDAAASAVYGARAAYGVILVKTKRGKGEQKVRVNYRGQFGLQEATKLPEFLNAYEYAKLYNRAVDNTPSSTYSPYTNEQLEAIRTHSTPNVYGDENMLDYLKKFGSSSTHSLSLNGGNQFVNYYISGGYASTTGLYSGIGRDRYNYSVKLDATLLKGLVFSIDMNGSRSDNKNTSYTTIDAAYNYSPLQVLRFTDGSLASISGSNPLIAVDGLGGYVKNKFNMSTITANLNYDIPFVKGLSAYLRATFDNNSTTKKTFNSPVPLYLFDKNTNTTSQDPLTVYPKAKISLEERDQFVDNKLLEAGVNYSRIFAAKHNVSGLLVANYQDYNVRYLDGTNQDMPGVYPEVMGTATSALLSGDESYTERASLIGRLTYGYDNRYFLEGNFRVDGSTKFAPDKRWGFFPSVSASWVLSNEEFFKTWKQDVLSNVKFRGSMGLLGNDGDVDNFSYLLNYMYSLRQGYNIGSSIKPGVVLSTGSYPNPDLTWGKSRDYNIATDLGFWNNRLGLSFEYYWRYQTDMLAQAPSYLYPPSTGVEGNLPYMNFGKLKAWGWDLTITHKNTINKFKYDAELTLSKTNDKYLDYGDESSVAENKKRVGTSSMVWWMYQADGLFKSYEEIQSQKLDQDNSGNATLAPGDIKYKDQNGDGKLTDADKIPVKNSSYPDLSMSFKLNLKYNGFFINAMFQGLSGYKKNIKELYSLENSSLQRFQQYHLTDTWTPENPDAEYPRIKFATANDNNRLESTFWVKNCDFVRLKTLSFGYALPASVLKKLKISSLSLSLQGSNLVTWSTLKDMDPESLRGYPIQRSYAMTLNFGF